jgi:hypothetical protein
MNKSYNSSVDTEPAGWEHLPPALRMAAMSGHVNPRYTGDRKKADTALSAALKESFDNRNSGPRYNWDRSKTRSSRQIQTEHEERRKSLREGAEAVRRHLAQLDGTSPAIGSVAASSTASASIKNAANSQHDTALLRKKLKKVEKLIATETPGCKEYKKLQKKRAEYISQLGEVEVDDVVSDGAIYHKKQLCFEAGQKREESERAATENPEMQRDAEASELRRQEKEAADEAERRKKETIREEARRLREEALEKKRHDEEQAEEAHNRRRAMGEEARRRNGEALARKQIEGEAAEVKERRKQEALIEEATQLKEKTVERRSREKESAIVPKALTSSAYEMDEAKRKKAFLEEARALKQAAMEKKRQEELAAADIRINEAKRKESFLEEARQLKAAAMAKKAAEEAEEVTRRANAEEEEERRRIEAVEAEQELMQLRDAQRREEEIARSEQARNERKQEASQEYLDRRSLSEPYSENTRKILRELESMEDRNKKLEKSLVQNGIPLSEDIPYEVAKDKIAEITESMKDLASADMDPGVLEKKYNYLEEQLAKYSNALMLTDEYAEEQKRSEQEWEDAIETDNVNALMKIRSHMPVNVKIMTENELATTPTPNGKCLPKSLAKKFKRTNILQLLRVNPDEIEKMHPSLLEGIRTTGLTLTERRAIHEHLRDVSDRWEQKLSDPSSQKKYQWFQALKFKFKEMLNAYTTHVDKYGPPGNHPYAKRDESIGGGCPLLGNQCPLKADAVFDYSEDYGHPKGAIFESEGQSSMSRFTRKNSQPRNDSKSMESVTKIMDELRERLSLDSFETDVDKKLLRELFHLERRTRSLEKQLTQAGLALPQEDISYDVAKGKVAEITEEMKKIATKMGITSDVREMTRLESEFGRLSQELDKYNNAMMLTKEWTKEQEDKEKQWEVSVAPDNFEALQKIWRHMPVNIRDLSEEVLSSAPTLNGKTLPKAMAKKFKRTNILMLLRMDPADIEPMHPSSLEALRTTGLTLTERRALHEHLKTVAPKWQASSNDKMSERRWMWHASLKGKFKEVLENYEHHVHHYGPPGNHPYAARSDPTSGGCPLLGNLCPVKADLVTDYHDDYGFPDYSVYMKENVARSNLMTMEELERRRREDEMEYCGHGCPPVPSPAANNGVYEESTFGHMGVGLISAVQVSSKNEALSTNSSTAPKPALEGLMAEMHDKGAATKVTAPDSPSKRMKLGMLAAITGRGQK